MPTAKLSEPLPGPPIVQRRRKSSPRTDFASSDPASVDGGDPDFCLHLSLSLIVTGIAWRWIFNSETGINLLFDGLGINKWLTYG